MRCAFLLAALVFVGGSDTSNETRCGWTRAKDGFFQGLFQRDLIRLGDCAKAMSSYMVLMESIGPSMFDGDFTLRRPDGTVGRCHTRTRRPITVEERAALWRRDVDDPAWPQIYREYFDLDCGDPGV